jgi:hypothetical protein
MGEDDWPVVNDPPETEAELAIPELPTLMNAAAPLKPGVGLFPPMNDPPVMVRELEPVEGLKNNPSPAAPDENGVEPPVNVPPEMTAFEESRSSPWGAIGEFVVTLPPVTVPPETLMVELNAKIPWMSAAPWTWAPETTFNVVAFVTTMPGLGPLTVCVPPSL